MLLAAAALLWLVPDGETDPLARAPPPSGTSPVERADRTLEQSDDSAAEQRGELSADSPPSSRDALVENRPPAPGPTIVVVEAETRRLQPDASVWMVLRDEISEEQWDALQRFEPETDAWIVEAGHPIELDGFASAELPGGDREAWIAADAGDRHLRRTIPLDSTDRVFLRLVRREALKLVTADPDGRRQRDVPVALHSLRLGAPGTWSPAYVPPAQQLARFFTDRDGEAMLARGSEILDAHLDDDGLATERVVVAALAFPCRDPVPRLIDPRTGCAEPVLLVTPPRSTLKVKAVDEEGLALDIDVYVAAEAVETPKNVIPVRRRWTTFVRARAIGEFSVEADAAIRLEAWSRDGWYQMVPQVTRSAPAAASSSLDLLLTRRAVPVKAGCFLFAGRVLALDGSPVRSAELAWQVDAGDLPQARGLARAMTDGDGWLRLEIPRSSATEEDDDGTVAAATRRLALFDGLEVPPTRGARRRGLVEFREPGPCADVTTRSIQLLGVPILVSGRVVDRSGEGVPDARVQVSEWSTNATESWELRSGADGRFWIRDTTRVRRLALRPAKEHWYWIDDHGDVESLIPRVVDSGAERVEFTLHRKGSTHGRLLVDPGISRTNLALEVLPRPARDVRHRLDPDGRFFLEAAPGRRTIAVRSQLGGEDPIRQVDDVELREGEETTDRRLDPIDLRGDLRQMELRVTSAVDGAPIRGVGIVLTRTRGFKSARGQTDPFGRAIVTTPTFDSAVALADPAWFIAIVPFDRSLQDVKLLPATVIRIRVEGLPEEVLRAGKVIPQLQLRRATRGGVIYDIWYDRLPRPLPRTVDATTIEFRATAAGDYSLDWTRPGDRHELIVRSRRDPIRVRESDDVVEIVDAFTEEEAARARR